MQCWFLPDHVSPKRTMPGRTQTVPPFGATSKSISGGSLLSQLSLMLTSPFTASSFWVVPLFFNFLMSAADAVAARPMNARARAIVRMIRLPMLVACLWPRLLRTVAAWESDLALRTRPTGKVILPGARVELVDLLNLLHRRPVQSAFLRVGHSPCGF